MTNWANMDSLFQQLMTDPGFLVQDQVTDDQTDSTGVPLSSGSVIKHWWPTHWIEISPLRLTPDRPIQQEFHFLGKLMIPIQWKTWQTPIGVIHVHTWEYVIDIWPYPIRDSLQETIKAPSMMPTEQKAWNINKNVRLLVISSNQFLKFSVLFVFLLTVLCWTLNRSSRFLLLYTGFVLRGSARISPRMRLCWTFLSLSPEMYA